MKKNLTKVLALTAIAFATITPSSLADVFELRTYTTNEGKLDDLNARFRDHTIGLFEKHGISAGAQYLKKSGATGFSEMRGMFGYMFQF